MVADSIWAGLVRRRGRGCDCGGGGLDNSTGGGPRVRVLRPIMTME